MVFCLEYQGATFLRCLDDAGVSNTTDEELLRLYDESKAMPKDLEHRLDDYVEIRKKGYSLRFSSTDPATICAALKPRLAVGEKLDIACSKYVDDKDALMRDVMATQGKTNEMRSVALEKLFRYFPEQALTVINYLKSIAPTELDELIRPEFFADLSKEFAIEHKDSFAEMLSSQRNAVKRAIIAMYVQHNRIDLIWDNLVSLVNKEVESGDEERDAAASAIANSGKYDKKAVDALISYFRESEKDSFLGSEILNYIGYAIEKSDDKKAVIEGALQCIESIDDDVCESRSGCAGVSDLAAALLRNDEGSVRSRLEEIAEDAPDKIKSQVIDKIHEFDIGTIRQFVAPVFPALAVMMIKAKISQDSISPGNVHSILFSLAAIDHPDALALLKEFGSQLCYDRFANFPNCRGIAFYTIGSMASNIHMMQSIREAAASFLRTKIMDSSDPDVVVEAFEEYIKIPDVPNDEVQQHVKALGYEKSQIAQMLIEVYARASKADDIADLIVHYRGRSEGYGVLIDRAMCALGNMGDPGIAVLYKILDDGQKYPELLRVAAKDALGFLK